MLNCRKAEIVMRAVVLSESAGQMSYTLSKEFLDGHIAYSIGMSQRSREGALTACAACDVSCEEETATEMFRRIAGGQVETAIFYDIIYDLLP